MYASLGLNVLDFAYSKVVQMDHIFQHILSTKFWTLEYIWTQF